MSAADRLREAALATGPHVISAAHAAAAAAGVAAYAEGGNAFDAALAACFMETVALPMKCGLAGDLVALVRRPDRSLDALVSVGPGPQAIAAGEHLERVGPRSVGVPGAPAGYAALHRHARLGLDRLVAGAVAAAERGIPWSRPALAYLEEAAPLLRSASPHNPYMPDGRMPAVGDLRRLPGLGDLLRRFVERRETLFAGPDGEHLVSKVRNRGGILAIADLHAMPARWASAARMELDVALALSATPGPTGGPRLLALIERARRDPRPLLDCVRSERIEAKQRGRAVADAGTSVVTAADAEGNAVVVLHSNSFPQFGSGVVLDSGLVLNNRPGRGFDLAASPGSANAPAAGRSPPTTLHAWALQRPGELLLGATPGGVNQLSWNAQTLTELLGGAAVADCVTNPRWALNEADELTAEEGAALPDGAAARRLPPFTLRSAQQILRLADGAPGEVAADPRAGACALAFY